MTKSTMKTWIKKRFVRMHSIEQVISSLDGSCLKHGRMFRVCIYVLSSDSRKGGGQRVASPSH